MMRVKNQNKKSLLRNMGNAGLSLWLSLIPINATAKTIYVDKTNATGNEDGSLEYPYVEIQRGVFNAHNGDVVKVSPGVYNESLEMKVNTSYTLEGSDLPSTVIKGPSRSALDFNTINASNVNDVTITNFVVTNGYKGFYLRGSDNITLEENIIIGNGRVNVDIYGGSNNTIINNTLDGASVYGNTRFGIMVDSTIDTIISNNIIVNLDRGISWSYSGNVSSLVSFNNFWNNLENFHIDNIAGLNRLGNLNVDPLFVNELDVNYELITTVTGPSKGNFGDRSPCIDAGTTNGHIPDGFTDMGAFNKYGNLDPSWPTQTPTETITLTPTITYTQTNEPTVTYSPSLTNTLSPTQTHTITPLDTNTPYPTQKPYPTYTPNPTYTPYPTPTQKWNEADLNDDGYINNNDLLMFMKEWKTQEKK